MSFLRDDRGVTSIEYALIAGSIFIAVVIALPVVAPALTAAFARILPGLQ